MYFDRFDIVEAHYLYYSHYHEGQWSDKYKRLCRILTKLRFKPRPNLSYHTLSENGQAIYVNLGGKVDDYDD